MEINQATQTFLLFFFIFVTSLLGFSIYIKKHEKLSKISLANAVETSILIVGIFALLVFGGSYYFVLSDVNASEQPLKDALSITASFFGGFATLTAAYIGSKLFNKWQDQHNKDVWNKFVFEVLDQFNTFEELSRTLTFESIQLTATLSTTPNITPTHPLTQTHFTDITKLIDKSRKLTHFLEQVQDRIRFFGIVGQCSAEMELLNSEFRKQHASIKFIFPNTYRDAVKNIDDYFQEWTDLSTYIEVNLIQKLLQSIQIKSEIKS